MTWIHFRIGPNMVKMYFKEIQISIGVEFYLLEGEIHLESPSAVCARLFYSGLTRTTRLPQLQQFWLCPVSFDTCGPGVSERPVSLLFVTTIISDRCWHYYTIKPLGWKSDGRTTGSTRWLCYQAWANLIQIRTLYYTHTCTTQPSVMLSGPSSSIWKYESFLFFTFLGLSSLTKLFFMLRLWW